MKLDLTSTFVVVEPNHSAIPVAATPTVFEELIHLRESGSFAIVPRETWHTARTSVPTRMLFVTPGEGTENKPL
jgi:hypothetical protein